MIEHYLPDGRRVYTVSEAAASRGVHPQSVRKRLNRRAARGEPVEPAGYVNPHEPAYHPHDVGVDMATGTKPSSGVDERSAYNVGVYEATLREIVEMVGQDWRTERQRLDRIVELVNLARAVAR